MEGKNLTIYMVSISRTQEAKNDLGLTVNSRDALGNVFFEDKADALLYAANCREQGLDAFVMPRIVILKESELKIAGQLPPRR